MCEDIDATRLGIRHASESELLPSRIKGSFDHTISELINTRAEFQLVRLENSKYFLRGMPRISINVYQRTNHNSKSRRNSQVPKILIDTKSVPALHQHFPVRE